MKCQSVIFDGSNESELINFADSFIIFPIYLITIYLLTKWTDGWHMLYYELHFYIKC